MAGMIERLVDCLEALPDPRDPYKVEHRLVDILVIAVCAVIGEAESFEDIADYGRCKRPWLAQFLALPNGIPSHDTFRRVLMLVDPDAFERSFLGWVRTVFRPEEGVPRQVAIDGKAVRRSFGRRHGRSPLHLVSAYATEQGLVLAQRAAEEKRGELTVLPELLDGLDLEGCLVSLDALACRPEIAERIVGRGGDYLLALKGNRRKAHAEVKDWFATNAFALGAPLRPYLSSAKLPSEALAAAIRNHRRVENGLHWVLDVTFREDASRVRERNAARNLALLRKVALNLVRADGSLKASLRGKRKHAGWDNAFMATLIAG
jgi:predicted transposase YbfD/YdcC